MIGTAEKPAKSAIDWTKATRIVNAAESPQEKVKQLISEFNKDEKYKQVRDRALKIMNGLNFSYHNEEHGLAFEERALIIAMGEKVPPRLLLHVSLIGVLHDTGFKDVYNDNEPKGAETAEREMRAVGYGEEVISMVKDTIVHGTTLPQRPRTQLEKIAADADLANLGTHSFFRFAKFVWLEREKQLGRKIEPIEWLEGQVKFLESHAYFTDTAKWLYGKVQEENLKKVKSMLAEFKATKGTPRYDEILEMVEERHERRSKIDEFSLGRGFLSTSNLERLDAYEHEFGLETARHIMERLNHSDVKGVVVRFSETARPEVTQAALTQLIDAAATAKIAPVETLSMVLGLMVEDKKSRHGSDERLAGKLPPMVAKELVRAIASQVQSHKSAGAVEAVKENLHLLVADAYADALQLESVVRVADRG